MSKTRGGSGSGYSALFRVGVGPRGANAESGTRWNTNNSAGDFARRFGLSRVYERNYNLIKTLDDPKGALQEVNNNIFRIATQKDQNYQGYLDDLRNLGFGEQESIERADIMIGREIENDLFLLGQRYPYAVGGAAAGGWDPVSAILSESNGGKLRRLPRTFQAIQSSGGLGTGGPVGKKISKKQALKRRLRAKHSK